MRLTTSSFGISSFSAVHPSPPFDACLQKSHMAPVLPCKAWLCSFNFFFFFLSSMCFRYSCLFSCSHSCYVACMYATYDVEALYRRNIYFLLQLIPAKRRNESNYPSRLRLSAIITQVIIWTESGLLPMTLSVFLLVLLHLCLAICQLSLAPFFSTETQKEI